MITSERRVQTDNNHRASSYMSGETRVANPQFGGMVLVELHYPKSMQNLVRFSQLLADLQGVSYVYWNS